MRLGQRRFQFQRLLIACNRLVKLALSGQRDAEVVVDLRIIRLEVQRLPVAGHSFIQLANSAKSQPQMKVTRCRRGIVCQRLAKILDGQFVLALLMSQDTHELQRAGMRGIDSQDLLINVLCLGEVSRLMMPQSQTDRLC